MKGSSKEDVWPPWKLTESMFTNSSSSSCTRMTGLAHGLVELGSKSAPTIEDMVAYTQETKHEKILRALAVGIYLIM